MAKDTVRVDLDTGSQDENLGSRVGGDGAEVRETDRSHEVGQATQLGEVELQIGERLRVRIKRGQDGTRIVVVELITREEGANGTVPSVGTKITEGSQRVSLHQLDGPRGGDPAILISPAPDGRTMDVTVEVPHLRGKPIQPWPKTDTLEDAAREDPSPLE